MSNPQDNHDDPNGAANDGAAAPAAADATPADASPVDGTPADVTPPEVEPAEEVVAEGEAAGAGAVDVGLLAARIERLEAELATTRAERDELTGRLRTVSAAYKQQQDDVSAARKRLERLAAEKEEIRRGEVVGALFEPLQNLRRSKEALEKAGVEGSHTAGLEMVIRQVSAAFEGLGMEEVPGKGSRFNPNLHEALTTMPVQDPALDHVVIEVYETGYRLGSRLIRPARVIIGAYTPPEEEAENGASAGDAGGQTSGDEGGGEA